MPTSYDIYHGFQLFFWHFCTIFVHKIGHSHTKNEKISRSLKNQKQKCSFFCYIFIITLVPSVSRIIERYKDIVSYMEKLYVTQHKNLSKFCKLRLWFIMKIYYPKKMNIVIRYTHRIDTHYIRMANINNKTKKFQQQQQDKIKASIQEKRKKWVRISM